MRMISRKQALEIVNGHGWGPYSCTNGDHRHPKVYDIGDDTECGTFYHNLGIHDRYAIIDVKHWLGY